MTCKENYNFALMTDKVYQAGLRFLFSSQWFVVTLRGDVTCACVVWNTRARSQSKQVIGSLSKDVYFIATSFEHCAHAREGIGKAAAILVFPQGHSIPYFWVYSPRLTLLLAILTNSRQNRGRVDRILWHTWRLFQIRYCFNLAVSDKR